MSAKSRMRHKPERRRCARCGQPLVDDGDGWSWLFAAALDGLTRVESVVCGSCTTLAEFLEREVRDSTTQYIWRDDERLELRPKIPATFN